MRVLLASLRGLGGIATYTRSLAAGLAAAGHEVVLVDETMAHQAGDPRITVAPFPARWRLPYEMKSLEGWKLRPRVLRLARSQEVDVVHATTLGLAPRHERLVITAWDPLAGPLARYRAARERGLGPVEEAGFALADAAAGRRAAGVVAVTAAVQEAMWRRGRRSELIPCFLEDSEIEDRVDERSPNRSHDVVLAGKPVDGRRKGLDLAIETVAALRETLPAARLVLVGDWIDAERRRALPEFCDARGELAAPELRETLRGAGCLLIASRWEEFGYVGLEALAAGTPVACTPLPAYAEISGGGVFRAAERSPAALASSIRAALGCTTFEFPQECRASVAIPHLVDLYRAIGAG